MEGRTGVSAGGKSAGPVLSLEELTVVVAAAAAAAEGNRPSSGRRCTSGSWDGAEGEEASKDDSTDDMTADSILPPLPEARIAAPVVEKVFVRARRGEELLGKRVAKRVGDDVYTGTIRARLPHGESGIAEADGGRGSRGSGEDRYKLSFDDGSSGSFSLAKVDAFLALYRSILISTTQAVTQATAQAKSQAAATLASTGMETPPHSEPSSSAAPDEKKDDMQQEGRKDQKQKERKKSKTKLTAAKAGKPVLSKAQPSAAATSEATPWTGPAKGSKTTTGGGRYARPRPNKAKDKKRGRSRQAKPTASLFDSTTAPAAAVAGSRDGPSPGGRTHGLKPRKAAAPTHAPAPLGNVVAAGKPQPEAEECEAQPKKRGRGRPRKIRAGASSSSNSSSSSTAVTKASNPISALTPMRESRRVRTPKRYHSLDEGYAMPVVLGKRKARGPTPAVPTRGASQMARGALPTAAAAVGDTTPATPAQARTTGRRGSSSSRSSAMMIARSSRRQAQAQAQAPQEAGSGLVLKRVAKRFGDGSVYAGTVSEWIPAAATGLACGDLFAIRYDDGDSEDMFRQEVEESIGLFDQTFPSSSSGPEAPVAPQPRAEEAVPEKRGRGRPRKAAIAVPIPLWTAEAATSGAAAARGAQPNSEVVTKKRGRGRPRKTVATTSQPPLDTTAALATATDRGGAQEAPPAKRGRGRPRK